HNRRQRAYFEGAPKRTMVPGDTPYLRRHVREVLAAADVRAGERVLEIGCGMGRYTLLLARQGFALEGLDLSPVLLERLHAYHADAIGGEPPALHCADVTDPPAALHGRFDVVLGFFMLHHLDDLDPCFRSVARLLRPGGRAVFLEPNPWNPLYYVQIALTPGMRWQAERGIARMRARGVFDAFAAAGLARPSLRRFGFLPPFAVNRPAGRQAEAWLERFPLWRGMLPFQVFRAERP
ncbi:MAG TPA: class I SAM-dependent methyltransferase, partial [Myxococcota bacterium]|nr:class I SAM-dependent methyltransferase [Myxococcota bacterium]